MKTQVVYVAATMYSLYVSHLTLPTWRSSSTRISPFVIVVVQAHLAQVF